MDITILTPVYKRNNFLQLWLYNIKNQNYNHNNLQVIIDECESDEPFIEDMNFVKSFLHPIKVYRVVKHRRSIGEKRNHLIKLCKTKVFAFMDSDDIYLPTYISYSYDMMKKNNVKLVGSDQMAFTFPKENYKITFINCGGNPKMIHEATLMCDKKFFNSTCKFKKSSQGEGQNIFQGLKKKNVFITDIRRLMICIVHSSNTIDKSRFSDSKYESGIHLEEDIIKFINNIIS